MTIIHTYTHAHVQAALLTLFAAGGYMGLCSVWGGDCFEKYMSLLAWYDQIIRIGKCL